MHNMNLLLVRLIFVDISALLLFITDIENKCVTFNQDYQRYVLLSAKKEKKERKKVMCCKTLLPSLHLLCELKALTFSVSIICLSGRLYEIKISHNKGKSLVVK